MSKPDSSRRQVLAAATVVLPVALAQTKTGTKLKIIGVSCSARRDKTTAAAVKQLRMLRKVWHACGC